MITQQQLVSNNKNKRINKYIYLCLIFILISSVDFDMLMSIIEYKHSYLNIIVAVVFVAKIVVDFGFESVDSVQ